MLIHSSLNFMLFPYDDHTRNCCCLTLWHMSIEYNCSFPASTHTHTHFLTNMKKEKKNQWSVLGALVVQVSRRVDNFNIALFLDTINVINVTLCKMALQIEFYLIMSLLVTFTLFLGHSSVKLFQLKIVSSYQMKLKL